MIILDANIWIAHAFKEDSQHDAAMRLMENLKEPVLLLEQIVAEVCTVLARCAGKPAADRFIDETSASNNITLFICDDFLFRRILYFYRRQTNDQLSFIDVALLYLSQSHTVLTFDKKLQRAIERQKRNL